jgi:hypothetical protein
MTYAFEFRLPFPEIDQVRLSVGFRGGQGQAEEGRFFVDEVSLVAIDAPTDAPDSTAVRPATTIVVDALKLVPLGGRWSYLPREGEDPTDIKGLVFDDKNAQGLFYRDGKDRYSNPFAENMTAWLRKGYLDLSGKLVEEDPFQSDNLTITFDATAMIVRARNLPNHPTSKSPSPREASDRNPNYIQEKDTTFYLPLNPERHRHARHEKRQPGPADWPDWHRDQRRRLLQPV